MLVSEQSLSLALTLMGELREQNQEVTIYHTKVLKDTTQVSSLAEATASLFETVDAMIFIGAMGICVRCIAPLVHNKYEDPAIVVLDSTGHFAIPVLSGHIGGANDLARLVATVTGGEAVITTQSDTHGLWALDLLASRFSWGCKLTPRMMNKAIALFVDKQDTALILEANDNGCQYLESTAPSHVRVYHSVEQYRKTNNPAKLAILVSPQCYSRTIFGSTQVLQYIPHVLHLGIGCQKAAPKEIAPQLLDEIRASGFDPLALATLGTIELKKDEPLLAEVARLCPRAHLHIYSAEELNKVNIPNPSQKVFETTGAYGVAEAAASIENGYSTLVVEKQKGKIQTTEGRIAHYTWALSMDSCGKRKGHIEIVGAGPGDPELISLKGRRMLERADLILYAGSLVPRQLTECAKPGAMVRSSASMDLEEQFELMKRFYDQGGLVVRLHTGDPCIYGAIQEQMNYFDKNNMEYHITPGISSFLAAAAELKSQFTIPERCQTIILTRGEGRTPMPEKEKLHLLARSQSTMCIFLSASIAQEVQDELLTCYPPETPVAACYKLTWKEQKIYRGQLKNLAQIMKTHNLTLTTMIVVGEAIGNRQGLSKLYDASFTHAFREGKKKQ